MEHIQSTPRDGSFGTTLYSERRVAADSPYDAITLFVNRAIVPRHSANYLGSVKHFVDENYGGKREPASKKHGDGNEHCNGDVQFPLHVQQTMFRVVLDNCCHLCVNVSTVSLIATTYAIH